MLDFVLGVPLTVRLFLLAVLGVAVGGWINWAIYSLAYDWRPISPWTFAVEHLRRSPWDRVPLWGWLRLRREVAEHGRGFWIRPLLVEVATGAAFAWLYWWEVDQQRILPAAGAAGPAMLHAQYANHVLLFCFLMVATFIDFDEQTIPDAVTIPATLLAFILTAALPSSLLPSAQVPTAPLWPMEPWDPYWSGPAGLLAGVACFLGWAVGVAPRCRWTARRGVLRGLWYLAVSTLRYCRDVWWQGPWVWATGAAAVAAVWTLGGSNWQGLFASLVGCVFGGGLVWAIRIVAGGALRVEAMGFGDVTLMAMIGAFLGWQAALLAFFIAPFTSLFVFIAHKLITRKSHFAFGPFLALGAVIAVVGWRRVWVDGAAATFALLGSWIGILILAGLLVGGAMLLAWRILKEILLGGE